MKRDGDVEGSIPSPGLNYYLLGKKTFGNNPEGRITILMDTKNVAKSY